MKKNIKRFTVKITAALAIAATVMSTAAPVVARADEMEPQVTESVETNESAPAETPAEPAPAPVAEEQPEVEGQGDIIDDQFAAAPEAETPKVPETAPANETQPEAEGQGDIIDDQFAVAPVAETPAEPAVTPATEEQPEVEGQGDIIDDQFAASAAKEKEHAPAVNMGFHNTFLGYHGTRVDYEDLVPGKFYLMQIPKRSKIPTFSYAVVKIKDRYTNKGVIFDDVMVKYDRYNTSGKLVSRNRKTQVNTNLLNMTPNHFYEITDDILAK